MNVDPMFWCHEAKEANQIEMKSDLMTPKLQGREENMAGSPRVEIQTR